MIYKVGMIDYEKDGQGSSDDGADKDDDNNNNSNNNNNNNKNDSGYDDFIWEKSDEMTEAACSDTEYQWHSDHQKVIMLVYVYNFSLSLDVFPNTYTGKFHTECVVLNCMYNFTHCVLSVML